jgi:glycosyltransferase involved in cell wall biosynthesis
MRVQDARCDPGGSDESGASNGSRRLLVVSHPAVVSVNQEVYRELSRRGWQVTIVVPARWRHDYTEGDIVPQALEGLESALRPLPVLLPGRQQRHLYLTSVRAQCRRARPQVAFIEEEPFALPTAQWGLTLSRLGVPFGVQNYENIDRALPAPIRWLRTRVLHKAAFVAARSQTAAELAREWGARGEIALTPPPVPALARPADEPSADSRPFTVGCAGRLIESKGLMDVLAAVRRLQAPVELVLIGDGALRGQLEGQSIPGSTVRVIDDLRHEQMGAGYAQLDVLVLASHTTPTWKEQFGRVIIEALWCGVPVVGSDSGEIPWLIGLTGGGLVFAEGDVEQLAERLTQLREAPALRRELAAAGKATVERMFTVPAATDPLERLLENAVARTARRA